MFDNISSCLREGFLSYHQLSLTFYVHSVRSSIPALAASDSGLKPTLSTILTMRFFVSAAAVVALTPVVFAQTLKIDTVTNPTQCEPLRFTWDGGSPPYYLSLVPGGQPAAPALMQFPAQSGNSMTWIVNFEAGEPFSSSLRDSTGAQAFSDIQTVQSGPDSRQVSSMITSVTTLPASSTVAGTSAASTTATTAAVPPLAQKVISTTGLGSASVAASETVAHAASSVASTTRATATSSNAASLHNSAGAIGVAGVLGLVGAALLG
ncbi:hypothetical protein BC628DRAFT_1421674 [Trametes gibbosa]|nr:hypothetical protein BC628DRAFT_1421674 [Trametes gibbosa]